MQIIFALPQSPALIGGQGAFEVRARIRPVTTVARLWGWPR